MKTWKKILIVALCVLSVAALVFACLMCKIYYEKYHKSYYWENLARPISENILMVDGYEGEKGFARLKDIRTNQYITPKLQHIFINDHTTEDSIVVFRTFDRLRGYLNVNTGQIVIPAQYNRAWNFSEGLAAVLKDGVVSFIKENGELAFEQTFPIYYNDDHNNVAFQFHNGLCVMCSIENKWGLINTRGEWVIEPIYTSIHAPYAGYRIITDGEKSGLLTVTGEIALPLEYDFIRPASHNPGYILAKNGIAQEVDSTLNVIVPFVYDGLHVLDFVDPYRSHSYEEDGITKFMVPKYWRYDVGYGSGVIDSDGNVIIPAKYYMVRIVDESLFEVETTYGGERILINAKGQYAGKSK